MVTGASTADLAVILIDARKGVLTQTRRHCYLVSLLGIRHVVLAVNKMDLVGYSQERLRPHRGATTARSPRRSGSTDITAIPISALHGRQHHRAQRATCPGTTGPTLMEHLETVRDRRRRGRRRAVPLAGAVGQPARPRLPRLRRHDRQRHGARAATAVARAAVRAREPRSRASSPTTATCDAGGRRPVGHADPDRRDRRQPRRRASRRPTRRPRSPTSSRPPSSGWTRSRCCRAAPYLLKIGTRTVTRHRHRAQAQGQRQHAGARWPPRRWS